MAIRSISWPALIDEVHNDPEAVIEQATLRLGADPLTATEVSGLQWARGLALRECGDLERARVDLVEAIEHAHEAGNDAMGARVKVSLSIIEMSLGDTVAPHRLLDEAEPHLDGRDLGRLVMQRGLLHHRAGHLDLAVDNYRRALPMAAQASDRVDEVKLRLNLGLLMGQTGDPQGGAAMLATARETAKSADLTQLAAMAAHNLGYMSALLGRTPDALVDYAAAEELFKTVKDWAHVAIVGADRAALYAQAGLHDEAYDEARRVRDAIADSGNVLDLAETELVLARAALAAEHFDQAIDAAERAGELFSANSRTSWDALARFVQLVAELKRGQTDVGLATTAQQLADELLSFGWQAESVHVRVVAAERLIGLGETDAAVHLLDAVAPPRRGLPVVDGLAAWTALAMRSMAQDDFTSSRRAVTRGLDLLRSNALAIQALDLRAHVVDQGRSLAEIGTRLAIRSGKPRELLGRMESSRAATVRTARLPPAARESVARALASLRLLEADRMRLIEQGRSPSDIDRERAQAEESVRTIRRQLSGAGSQTVTLADGIAQLGTVDYLGFEDVDGETWAVSLVNGRTKLHHVEVDLAREMADTVPFALNRLARTHASAASISSAHSMLGEAGLAASDLLPERIRASTSPLVISPSASMSEFAWRVIAGMHERSFCVAPSLAAWALAVQVGTKQGRRTLAVGGPGLVHADREIDSVRSVSASGTSISSKESSIEWVLEGLDAADVAHFACHGTFRADNPMFSSLRLADGDLTIYDLEQCEQLPHTMVLSACNAGQSAVLRGGALLGLASALIQLGVSSVIAPLTPVNDERSVDLMVRLHTHLAAGVPAAEALAKASIGPDGELDPTAAPFICFGS